MQNSILDLTYQLGFLFNKSYVCQLQEDCAQLLRSNFQYVAATLSKAQADKPRSLIFMVNEKCCGFLRYTVFWY